MNRSSYVAGIDVAKLSLDVHLLPHDQARRFPNNPTGHAELVALLKRHQIALVVLEATGGYERAAVVALVKAGLRVHVAQPQVVRAFAVSHKLRAKNDRIDAWVCACYAQERGPELPVIDRIDPTIQKLQDLVTRRDQLVGMRTMETNRQKQASDKAVGKSIQRILKVLDKEIARAEKEIDALIQADPILRARSEKVQEVKGVGPQTARLLMACLPELGRGNPKRLNALVGVAPYAADSGNRQGPRAIAGGRKLVRDGLFMACMAGMTRNPVLAAHYRALTKRGLAHKTAIISCIRKLLAHLDAQLHQMTNAGLTVAPAPSPTDPGPSPSGGSLAGA